MGEDAIRERVHPSRYGHPAILDGARSSVYRELCRLRQHCQHLHEFPLGIRDLLSEGAESCARAHLPACPDGEILLHSGEWRDPAAEVPVLSVLEWLLA